MVTNNNFFKTDYISFPGAILITFLQQFLLAKHIMYNIAVYTLRISTLCKMT